MLHFDKPLFTCIELAQIPAFAFNRVEFLFSVISFRLKYFGMLTAISQAGFLWIRNFGQRDLFESLFRR